MGFFSSRKAEPTPLSLSELNASPGSVKVIKSRFYGKSKSTTTNTNATPNVGTMPSSSASGSNMNSNVNFPASASSQPVSSSSQPQPLRHVSTDPLTTTLAEKLNELALANADGLLDDEAHRLLRQNLFERFAQAEAQSQTTAWGDTSTASTGSARKRFSGGYGPSGTINKGNSNTWRNSNLVSSPPNSHQSPSKTLNRAPSIESQRSIATAVSSLFRRATRRSGSSHSRGPTSLDGFSQDGDHLHGEYDIEHQETSSIYSRPSFSSNYRRNNPYSGAYGSMVRGVIPRQLSNDSLASVGTGVGSVAGSVAGSVSVAGFPSHLQIYSSHFGGGSVPPSPSSASAAVDLRALSVPRRMQGNYASSISSRTTSRSNKPPSSFHLRHGTSASSSTQNQPQPPLPPFPPTRLSISALVRERSHEDDVEDDEYAYGYDDVDEKKNKDPHSSSSGSKPLKSAAALRAEIEAVEMEGRKMFDAFNALELSVLTKGGRMHGGGGLLGVIGSVPEETSIVALDAISIKSAKSGSVKDKGGSSASTSGMSGSTVPTIGSSSAHGSTSTSTSTSNNSTTTATTTSATSVSVTSSSNAANLSPPPPHPALHTSHSSPSLLTNPTSTLTPKSRLRLATYTNRDGASDVHTKDPHPTPAIPISSPPKRRPSLLLQRKKTGKTKVVLPPSIAAASLEIREERERERDKDGVGVGLGTGTSHSIGTIASSSSQAPSPVSTSASAITDRSTTSRVRTRSHSRERPAREKPPPSLQAQQVPPVPKPSRSPSPPPPIPALSSVIPKLYSKHPYADTSLALSVVIPDSGSDTPSQQQEQQTAPHPSLSSLSDELDTIRRRRATVTRRYERRLDFLRAKLKSAEIREMLK